MKKTPLPGEFGHLLVRDEVAVAFDEPTGGRVGIDLRGVSHWSVSRVEAGIRGPAGRPAAPEHERPIAAPDRPPRGPEGEAEQPSTGEGGRPVPGVEREEVHPRVAVEPHVRPEVDLHERAREGERGERRLGHLVGEDAQPRGPVHGVDGQRRRDGLPDRGDGHRPVGEQDVPADETQRRIGHTRWRTAGAIAPGEGAGPTGCDRSRRAARVIRSCVTVSSDPPEVGIRDRRERFPIREVETNYARPFQTAARSPRSSRSSVSSMGVPSSSQPRNS